jgi:hypothetical protein
MRTALLLICLFLFPVAAHAATPTQLYEREARQYLKPCHMPDADQQHSCLLNQYNFIVAYVYAMSGDTYSMGIVASSFMPPSRSSENDVKNHLGMTVSFVQACAWRIAVAASTNGPLDAETVRALCSRLIVNDFQHARLRGQQILTLIQTSPAVAAPNFDPMVPGLPPATKVDPKCLDSTVQPLTASPTADTTPSPQPPKGCPGNP